VQREMAERVANPLTAYGVITDACIACAKRKSPENLEAYDLYLLGTEARHRHTKEGVDEGIRLLTWAVEMDPSLGDAAPGEHRDHWPAQGRRQPARAVRLHRVQDGTSGQFRTQPGDGCRRADIRRGAERTASQTSGHTSRMSGTPSTRTRIDSGSPSRQ
jgi:hypothetical protein